MSWRGFFVSTLVASVVAVVAPVAAQAGFVVNGQLNDWGVTVADNNGSNINSYTGASNVIGFHSEDTDDLAGDNFFLGPNYGGQNYDAEFMGVGFANGKLYISVVTGQRPDNGFRNGSLGLFGPGDLRIVTKLNGQEQVYGLEVGGGAVNGASSSAVLTEGGAGSTYTLDSNGYTTGHTKHTSGQLAGTLWLNPNWINDPIVPQGPTQMQMAGGTYVGMTDYFYSLNSLTSQHAIIEVGIDANLFGGADLLSIHWRPSCGNDELNFFNDDNFSISSVPEPTSGVLAGLGLVCGLGFTGWRRLSARKAAGGAA